MASDDFSATNSPLASPWTSFGGSFGGLRSVSGGVRNVAGSDTDAGAWYSSSSATSSQMDYVSGTTDGGPALHMGTGPDGYVITAYDGAIIYAFRLDDGSYSSELGHATGVYVAGQPTKLRRSGGNLITSVNAVDKLTVTDSTYTGGSPGIFSYAGNLIQDNWTDGASSSYTLAMGQGSLALNGQAVSIKATRRMSAAQGSYALSGQAVTVKYGPKTALAQGAYALTGQAVTLVGPIVGYSLSLAQGAYSLVGSDATADYAMSIGMGAYALSGQNVGLGLGHKMAAGQGSYALTGQILNFSKTNRLLAVSASYALTGQDLAFDQTVFSLPLESGQYSLQGNSVRLVGPEDNDTDIFHNLPLTWWTK